MLPFERKVEDKKMVIKKIEDVTKKTKLGNKSHQRAQAKAIAMENAELLFKMLHGAENSRKEAKKRSQSVKL